MYIILVNRSFSEYLQIEIMFFCWYQKKARETIVCHKEDPVPAESCLQQGCELLLMKSRIGLTVIFSSGASQATCGGNTQQNSFP